jgi:hypothetical protein
LVQLKPIVRALEKSAEKILSVKNRKRAESWWLLGRLRSGELWLEASPGKYFARPLLQNNLRKMDWRCGSSGKDPAL